MLFEAVYDRVEYPAEAPEGLTWNPAYVGFWVDVRINADGRMERHTRQLRRKAGTDDGLDEWCRYNAPRIAAWGFQTPNADGETVDVPAPGEMPDNWEAFLLLPLDLLGWVMDIIQVAHLQKLMASLLAPATPPATTPETEACLVNSPMPSDSDSTTSP